MDPQHSKHTPAIPITQTQPQKQQKQPQRLLSFIGNDQLACIMFFFSQAIWVFSFIYPNEHNFSPFQTMTLRGATVIVTTLIWCTLTKKRLDFHPSQCSMQSLNTRNIIMTIQGIVCAFVQFYLPLPIVHVIGCSGSIFVFIVDYVRNGIRLNKEQIQGIVIGFIGIVIVINNNVILEMFGFSVENQSKFDNYRTDSIMVLTLAALLFVAITILWAYAVVETKVLKKLNTFQINFHFGICILLISAFFYPVYGATATREQMFIGIFTTGIPMTIGQLLFIAAFGISEQHGKVSLMTFSLVLMSYFVSIFRYDEKINFFAGLGTILSMFGVLRCILNKK